MARTRHGDAGTGSDASKIQQIRKGLAWLAEIAPNRPELFTTKSTWSEEELARFESERGVSLPSGYRLYLREIGDGGAGFALHGRHGGLRSLRDADKKALTRLTKRSTIDEPVQPVPLKPRPRFDGWLLLGVTSDHCDYYLVVNGARAGEVWIDGSGIEEGSLAPDEPADFLDRMIDWIAGQKKALEQEALDRSLVEAFEAGKAQAALATLDDPAREHAMAVLFTVGPERMVELAHAGEFEKVVALAGRSLELFPDAFYVWDPLGFACMRLAQEGPAKARELASLFDPHIDRLAHWFHEPPPKRRQTIVSLLANVTAALIYAERFSDAVRLLERAHSSLQPFPFHNFINALLGDGEIDRAEQVVGDAFRREGDSAGYHVQLAKIFSRRGDDAKAIDELATVKRLGYPTFAGLRTNRDLLRMDAVPEFRALFDV